MNDSRIPTCKALMSMYNGRAGEFDNTPELLEGVAIARQILAGDKVRPRAFRAVYAAWETLHWSLNHNG